MSGPRFSVNQVWALRSGKHVRIVSIASQTGFDSLLAFEYVGITPLREGRSWSDNARRNWTFIGTFVGCK